MSKRDYYDVLGCGRDVDQGGLKKAYRRLAMKHHPDRNPDDPEAEIHFKEAKEAYEILSDGEKRAAYDSLVMQALKQVRGAVVLALEVIRLAMCLAMCLAIFLVEAAVAVHRFSVVQTSGMSCRYP